MCLVAAPLTDALCPRPGSLASQRIRPAHSGAGRQAAGGAERQLRGVLTGAAGGEKPVHPPPSSFTRMSKTSADSQTTYTSF
ncbi:hypothetical protein ILYODFUR_032813 [Ilyodon furcidens]|uniref:Uncharacterized protein n=1 Tax=Ilyodon furcidens TaxID=33524 RepID=A0ABV0U042_9TELE